MKFSEWLVVLNDGLATTVIEVPGVATIGAVAGAGSIQPDHTPLRNMRIRPLTFGTTSPFQPPSPCPSSTRTTVGLLATISTLCVAVWMDCVTWMPTTRRPGGFVVTTVTVRDTTPPHTPETVM